ncbi:Bifunctional protein PyrR [Frondihabitans sp. 762G35]|uniref:bifunctional pyr operon transcriptional regulator/uracil phosphoribosyltransferase PyrR n=1 Tax=Frondihabitans sp. 762G35 TaxID=1446794 RepID=UPI000D20687E|nr:bifunctional pyr operon transcriptional regulator/uracil phosphoribosyltransferase PyrR [Frondihabitans sp. 762G35]ARC56922.1 Bifunctional protein PyrR [Frondihabitans sp. 762G35]
MSTRDVLSQADIKRALTRIAHEILEANRGADDLVVLGVPTRGVILADRIGRALESISGQTIPIGAVDVTLFRDDLRRQPTRSPRPTSVPDGGIDGKTVVLVDDVLFSGRTIRAALDALSAIGRPSVVRLAVLVDRGHRELPIRADYVGKNLPSSAAERIFVRLAETDDDERVTIEGGEQ